MTTTDKGADKGRIYCASESVYDALTDKTDTAEYLVPVLTEDVPMKGLTGTSATLETGMCYWIHPTAATTFTVPTIASTDQDYMHNIVVMFDTYITQSVRFASGSSIYLDPAGVQTIEASKHYTATLTYRPYWTGSATAWKWVLTITEDIVTTSST